MMAEWVCYMLGVITGIAISGISNFWTELELYRVWEDYKNTGRN